MPHEKDYLQALETRLSWLRWSESDEGRWFFDESTKDTLRVDETRRLWHDALAEGSPTYYMEPIFCQLIDHLRRNVPDDLEFDQEWLQSPSGWMMIAEPFTTNDDPPGVKRPGQPRVTINAIGWKQASRKEHTMFALYFNLKQMRRDAHGFGAWACFASRHGFKLNEEMKFFEDNCQPEKRHDLGDRTTIIEHPIRLIYTAFWLMAQRIASTARAEGNRQTHHRMKLLQPAFEPLVDVVTLRRAQYEHKAGEPRPVDWQWQWMVNAHGRKQYYPSTGEHKYILVDSYVKGPQDKPLKPPSAKIYVARR